ncbi:MAG: efflux RND transporter periplasmic adaptor subunit [Caldilineaceae bacterium]|nr:efflux RND transporter periplasmic adaptor subunit [Caldilineaceae bacterium]
MSPLSDGSTIIHNERNDYGKGIIMFRKYLTHWRGWLTLLVAAALIAGSGYFVTTQTTILAQSQRTSNDQTTSATSTQLTTVAIQPADLAQTAVSAAGNLALVTERSVALAVDGIVKEIDVAVGDTVQAGETLILLDTTDLERAVAQAELTVETAKLTLADLQTPATASELAVAQANLVEAQENLADVKAGPSTAALAAAQSSLAAAQASYAALQAGPSDSELTQLSASLKKAEIALAEAQRSYNQIAWRNDVGMTSEAAALQEATIDYESTKAAYAESTASASTADLQSALSSIQNAQASLTELQNSPSAADIATAKAQVTEAEATLADLQNGATTNELRNAQITLQQALIALETAYRELDAATVVAPTDGVILALDAAVGVRSSSGTIVATLADPTQLKLAINVAEADIARVALGQTASIEIDALPGKTFAGVVQSITPVNASDSSAVSYPVTVRLTEGDFTSVLPGMNAVATLTSDKALSANSWLVPTNGLVEANGVTTVTVVRGTASQQITVVPSTIQGEWTIVESAELQQGDQVVGSITAGTESSNPGFPGGGGSGMPMGGPPQ